MDEDPDGESDAELWRRLAAGGFAGPEQDTFDAALVATCRPWLISWLQSGQVFRMCFDEGRPVTVDPLDRELLRTDDDERQQLADETLAVALVKFTRDALRGGWWRPDGGLSLRSAFVRRCVREFPEVFRRWSGDQRRNQHPDGRHHDGYGLHRPCGDASGWAPDLADDVVDRVVTTQELEQMTQRLREIAELKMKGMTHQEIAERLGISVETIRRELRTYGRPR